MKFVILSHEEAVTYNPQQNGFKNAVLIRITSMPTFKPLIDPVLYKGILYYTFDDITKKAYDELPIDEATRLELFAPKHVAELVSFFNEWKDRVDVVVVHCDAGISRSSAVAVALAEYAGEQDEVERIATDNHYWPNPHVWTSIREYTGWTAGKQNDYEELFGFLEAVHDFDANPVTIQRVVKNDE